MITRPLRLHTQVDGRVSLISFCSATVTFTAQATVALPSRSSTNNKNKK